MACSTLLFIIILTASNATSVPCSDQQPPEPASGDELPGPREVTIVQYCFDGSVIIVHQMFKELRTLFGKLLILHCLFPFSVVITYFVRLIVELSPTVRQLTACHFLILGIVVSAVGYEVTVTSMLHSLTYILYRSNQLQRVTKEESEHLHKWYITYIFGMIPLILFLMISYDLGIHQCIHILPNGDCTASDSLNTTVLSINGAVQKSAQLVLFAFYLYKYQLNKDVQNPDILESQEKVLHRLAVAMGATIRMALFLFLYFHMILS